MVVLKDIEKSFQGNLVLDKVSLSFSNGDCVGLVGDNGSGKSTLLKIMAGIFPPDAGDVDTSLETIGYLPQEIVFTEKNLLTLSGGEKTKAYLAKILFDNPLPTLLVLDEPTNNMDIYGMTWLENYLSEFKGITILTSHDRYFLDKLTNKTIELKNGKVKIYGGNYTFYVEQKEKELLIHQKAYLNQQKEVQDTKENINEFKQRALSGELTYTSRNPYEKKKAAKIARIAKVRERRLIRQLESSSFVEKPEILKKGKFTFGGSVPSDKLVLEVCDLSMSYGKTHLFDNASFAIRGKEHYWINGKNGSGKTTLLNIIMSKITPIKGTVRLGVNIGVGYLSQDMNLPVDVSGLDFLLKHNSDMTVCFNTARHMNLDESTLRRSISTLSFGQKVKLKIMSLLLQNNQLLILDEPTNHLEVSAREDVERALSLFEGALLVVSHDRYFIKKLNITHEINL